MPKRSRKKKPLSDDVNVLATKIGKSGNEDEPEPKESDKKNPHAVALGRLGGLKGGKARAQKLTPEQRREIARKAAKARWSKK